MIMDEEKWKSLENRLVNADSRVQAENIVRMLPLKDVNELANYLSVNKSYTTRAKKIVRIVDVTFESVRRANFIQNYNREDN